MDKKYCEENLYFSLDEARIELKKRQVDSELKKKIEDELGDRFMACFKSASRGVTFRQICSPDNGFAFFYQCANYTGTKPLIFEYHDDIFVSFNEEKKGLGRLRLTLKDGQKAVVDIMDFHAYEKMLLRNVKLKTGESLLDFHHDLFKLSAYNADFIENSKWLHDIGKAADYYYYFLLHFIVHGILFETFSLEEREKGEAQFVENVIALNLEKIEKKFGLRPIVVRSYPENQTDNEDFYWWSYPPNINDYIINYADKNKLKFKLVNL